MRFLLREEWNSFWALNESKIHLSNLQGIPRHRISNTMDSIYGLISKIVKDKDYNHEVFGIAMTLFHYYTYFKSLKDIDQLEISVACVYLACKVQFHYIPMDKVTEIYRSNSTEKPEVVNKKTVDFLRYEIEIYSFLGYHLDIETPYSYYYKLISSPSGSVFKKEDIKHLVFNLINDIYRRPLCLYYHPKTIMYSAVIIAAKMLEIKNVDFDSLLKTEKLNDIIECMEKAYELFDEYIPLNNNNNEGHTHTQNNNINNNENGINHKMPITENVK